MTQSQSGTSRFSRIASLTFASAVISVFVQCKSIRDRDREPNANAALWPEQVPDRPIDFITDVKPLLEDQCLECHNRANASEFAGLNLETRQTALTTGRGAPVIIPGDPKASLFIRVLKLRANHPTSMPAAPEKVEGVRLSILEKWIAEGAEWPDNARLQAR